MRASDAGKYTQPILYELGNAITYSPSTSGESTNFKAGLAINGRSSGQ